MAKAKIRAVAANAARKPVVVAKTATVVKAQKLAGKRA
jgi:hypothetical protein